MKILSSIVMAMLLFAVAFAGLSPPTQDDNSMTAASVHATSQADVEQITVQTVPDSNYKEKITHTVGVLTETHMRKNEVAARARNGSLTSTADVSLYESYKRTDVDIGMVRLL